MKIRVQYYYEDMLRRIMMARGEKAEPVDVERYGRRLFESAVDRLVVEVLGVEADSMEVMWWRLHSYWVSFCGQPPLRDGVPVDEVLLEEVLSEHGVDGVVEAMDNYRVISSNKTEYSWVSRMDFDEFLARGVEEFRSLADPFNRYRRVTAKDREKFLDKKPVKRRVPLKELDRLGSIVEYLIGRKGLGKNF